RGGVPPDVASTAHKAREAKLVGVLFASGAEPAQSHGLFGGLPACNTLFTLHTGTRVRDALQRESPVDLEALGGQVDRLPPQGLFELDAGGVCYMRAAGGGGWPAGAGARGGAGGGGGGPGLGGAGGAVLWGGAGPRPGRGGRGRHSCAAPAVAGGAAGGRGRGAAGRRWRGVRHSHRPRAL